MGEDNFGISAKVIADSTHDRSRLTTFEVTFPRFVLAEFNTHRVFSRNSASSRAIPVWKRLAEIVLHPFVPLAFGKNKAGMQATEEISEEDLEAATHNWLVGRDVALIQAFALAGGEEQIIMDAKGNEQILAVLKSLRAYINTYPDVLKEMRKLSTGVHKQHANRVLEPYAWHTVIVTGTHLRNFYALRASPMAQPEIKDLALAMAQAHSASVPRKLEHGEWHLPYIFEEDLKEIQDVKSLARISSARCGRVSYLTHDGKRSLEADLTMADSLQGNGHMSPFEHPARTHDTTGSYHGSFHGNFGSEWMQYRKMLGHDEHDFSRLIPNESLLLGMGGDQKLVDFVLSLRD